MTVTCFDVIEVLKPTLLKLSNEEGLHTGCEEDRLKQLIADAVATFETTQVQAEMLRYYTYKKLTEKAEEARQLTPQQQETIISQGLLKQEFENAEVVYSGFIIHCDEKNKQHIEKRYSNFLDEEPENAGVDECCFHCYSNNDNNELINTLVHDLKNVTVVLDFTEFFSDDEDGAGSKNDWWVSLTYKNAELVTTTYDKEVVDLKASCLIKRKQQSWRFLSL